MPIASTFRGAGDRSCQPVSPRLSAPGKAQRLIGCSDVSALSKLRLGRLPQGVDGSPDHPAGSARGMVDDELFGATA